MAAYRGYHELIPILAIAGAKLESRNNAGHVIASPPLIDHLAVLHIFFPHTVVVGIVRLHYK
jgi:hypothetical protein